jgi:ATP phosphoribosyltransferase regulatory subunit
MVEAITISGAVPSLLLDLGHVGIYRGLAQHAGLSVEQEQELFSVLQRKALPEIEVLLTNYGLSETSHTMLLALAELNGDKRVLQRAKTVLADAPESVKIALDTLEAIADVVVKRLPEVSINFDLSELRGYHYHTGLVFAAYQAGSAQAIAMGGRYDDVGEDFGHAQPATGFSLDLRTLVNQLPDLENEKTTISAVWSDDPQQKQIVEQLRNQGEIIIYQLSDNDTAPKTLIKQDGHWIVTETGTQTRG